MAQNQESVLIQIHGLEPNIQIIMVFQLRTELLWSCDWPLFRGFIVYTVHYFLIYCIILGDICPLFFCAVDPTKVKVCFYFTSSLGVI